MEKIITNSEKETFEFGSKLGQACRGGEVFALFGDLGAGKTKLLQGLAEGLGIITKVNSPTFNILKVYNSIKTKIIFCHIDAYRLRSGQDLLDLGIDEYFNSEKAITAIEWGEKILDILPKNSRIIKIKVIGKNKREISIV